MAKEHRRGRPPKAPEAKESVRLEIVVTPEVAKEMATVAGEKGTPTGWLKRVALAALGRP